MRDFTVVSKNASVLRSAQQILCHPRRQKSTAAFVIFIIAGNNKTENCPKQC